MKRFVTGTRAKPRLKKQDIFLNEYYLKIYVFQSRLLFIFNLNKLRRRSVLI